MKCPLTGKECNEPKCIFVTEVNKTSITELHLCQECGSKLIENKDLPKIENPTKNFLELVKNFTKQILKQPTIPQNVCKLCNSTIEDIIKSSRLGCANCYEQFKNELIPTLEKAHGNIKHSGKVPKNNKTYLENKLKELVKEEKYEEAAVIKKKLEGLQSLPSTDSKD